MVRTLAIASALPAAATGASYGAFQLRKFPQYCLDIPGGSLTNGNWLWLWECNSSPQQQWIWQDDGTIASVMGHMCIDVPGGNADNYWDLWLWECNGSDNQKWLYGKNPHTGAPELGGAWMYGPYGDWTQGNARCVDISGGEGNVGLGAQFVLYPCYHDANDGEPWLTPNHPVTAEMNFTRAEVV